MEETEESLLSTGKPLKKTQQTKGKNRKLTINNGLMCCLYTYK